MDGGRSNESKAASDDEDLNSPEQTDESCVPTNARYYNCIYCKRGFTCAQALGGHMNVHRKDRGRAQQQPNPPVAERTEYSSGGYNEHYRSYENDGSFYYSMYSHTTPSSRIRVASLDDGGSRRRPRELSFYGEDLNLEDINEEKGQDEEDGVDLELRLGRDA